MWFKKKPKHLRGIDAICRHFKIDSMDLWTWRRTMADKPPVWIENSVWITEPGTFKAWLLKHKLMPEKPGIMDLIKNAERKRHERRQQRNAQNWNRKINKTQSRDWQITDEKLKRGRMW
jgi:hypothetical protein